MFSDHLDLFVTAAYVGLVFLTRYGMALSRRRELGPVISGLLSGLANTEIRRTSK